MLLTIFFGMLSVETVILLTYAPSFERSQQNVTRKIKISALCTELYSLLHKNIISQKPKSERLSSENL